MSHVRVAQKALLEFPVAQKKVWVINLHLHHTIEEEDIRVHQMKGVFLWLKSLLDSDTASNIIIAGDFNATPDSATYKLLESKGFKSTHKIVKGEEPTKTFPTGLQAPFMDTDPEGTFDYVWYRGEDLKPTKIELFGDKPKVDDPTIYPSDHIGLAAEFMVSS